MEISKRAVHFLESVEKNIYCCVNCFNDVEGKMPHQDCFIIDKGMIRDDTFYFCDGCGALINN